MHLENSIDQPGGILGFRMQNHFIRCSLLGNLPVIEHDDPVAELLHQCQIVADEQIRCESKVILNEHR